MLTEETNQISTFWLRKNGYFSHWVKEGGIGWRSERTQKFSGNVGFGVRTIDPMYIKFYYTHTYRDEPAEDLSYKVKLMTTPCRFGGKRFWFICPLIRDGVECNRRTAILYIAGKYFGCRKCYKLTYYSQLDNAPYNRRYKAYPYASIFHISAKIEQLEKQIKRPYYKGKPIRKLKRIEKLSRKLPMLYQNVI